MNWWDRFLKKDRGKDPGQRRAPQNVAAKLPKQQPTGATVLRDGPSGAAQPIPIPTLPVFSEGERIADAYTIKRRLGAGAMGTVYLAHHTQWDLDIVLKVPNPEIL